MSASPYTLSCNSKLVEDYIHSTSMLGSATAANPMATFVNSQGQSEALLIHDNGELCHLQREPLSSSGWNIYGVGATLISMVAANSGSVWVMGQDQTIWQSNAGHWNNIPIPNAGAFGISVGQDGTVYGVGEVGDAFRIFLFDPTEGQFKDFGVVPITSAPVGVPGALWAIGTSGQVMTYISGLWAPAPGWNGEALQVEVSADGSVYALSTSGAVSIYVPQTQTWTPNTTLGQVTAIAAGNGVIYAQAGTTVQVADPNSWNWSSLPATPYTLEGISTGVDGFLWAFSSYGATWSFDGTNWNRQMMPTDQTGPTGGHTVTEVVTGRHSDGVQYAFYLINGVLSYSSLDESEAFGGYWTPGVELFTQSSSRLSATLTSWEQNGSRQLVVYGITDSGLLLIVQNINGTWTASTTSCGATLPQSTVQFTQPGYGIWDLFFVSDQRLALFEELGLAKDDWVELPLVWPNSPPIQTLVPFPAATKGAYTCVLDTSGQLWFVNAYNPKEPTFVQLSGSAVGSPIGTIKSAVVITSEQSGTEGSMASARVFACDENDSLWILRVTINDINFTWAQWHPLGDTCSFLSNGPTGSPCSDLFMLDEGQEVAVLSEDMVNQVWNELVMLKPQGTNTDAEYVSRYRCEITLTDQNGSPVPDLPIAVTADEAVGIWVGINLYNVGVTVPAQLSTDQFGRLTFAFFAGDLHTPTFSFAGDGLVNPPTLYAAQEVNHYLSGDASALPSQPRFDAGGTTLSGAVMQVAPDWESNATTNFIQTGVPQGNVAGVAQAITQVYTIPLTANAPAGQWAPAATLSMSLGSSDFWHDLCTAAHDIDHAIRKAALKVSSVVVDIENKLVQFTMELANGLSQVMNLVINTAKDIVSAVKSAFRYIERGVDDAIHWLKSLFRWSDIINTKLVLEAGFAGILGKLADNFNPTSPNYVGTTFDGFWTSDVIGELTVYLDRAKQQFAPTANLSTITDSGSTFPPGGSPAASDGLHPTGLQSAHSAHGAHTNYVHDHVTSYTGSGGTIPDTGEDGSQLQSFYSAITNNLANGSAPDPVATARGLNSSNLFSSPQNFANTAVYDIINALETAAKGVLVAVKDVIDELIKIVGDAIAAFQSLATKTIDIPVISWIYTKVSGGAALSLLDLSSLLFAVPTTLLYKLTFGIKGATAPFSAADVTSMQQNFSLANFPWPSFLGGNSEVSATRQLEAITMPSALGEVIMLIGFMYAINDAASDQVAWSAKPGDEEATAKFLSIAGIAGSVILQFLGGPYPTFPQVKDKAQSLTVALWTCNFLPVIVNIVFASFDPTHKVTEFNSNYGPYVCLAMGIILFSVGVATGVEQILDPNKQYNAYYYVPNFIAAIPTIMKPLVTVKEPPLGGIAISVLCATDLVIDGAAYLMGGLSDMT